MADSETALGVPLSMVGDTPRIFVEDLAEGDGDHGEGQAGSQLVHGVGREGEEGSDGSTEISVSSSSTAFISPEVVYVENGRSVSHVSHDMLLLAFWLACCVLGWSFLERFAVRKGALGELCFLSLRVYVFPSESFPVKSSSSCYKLLFVQDTARPSPDRFRPPSILSPLI